MSGFKGLQQRPGGGGAPRGLGSGSPGGGGGQDTRARIAALLRPPAQPVRYFAANDRAVRAELLGAEAEEVAKRLAPVPASQLRRFYAEVSALKRRAELGAAEDAEIRAQLTLLRAKAAYTLGRQTRYPDELVAFFNRHAHSVQGRDDFLRGFQPHFEAVMAFHKVFEEKKGAEA